MKLEELKAEYIHDKMKLEELKAEYIHDKNGSFQLQLTLKTSGANDFGSDGFARKVLSDFVEKNCPNAHLKFVGGHGSGVEYNLLYRNPESSILGSNTIHPLIATFISSKTPFAIPSEMFVPADESDETYTTSVQCTEAIQKYVGSDITPSHLDYLLVEPGY